RAEADGEEHPEGDRHLAEDVARLPLPDHALDAVHEPDRLDAALEHAEERPLVPLVHRELAGRERDVGGDAAEALARGALEAFEDADARDLLGRHHRLRRLLTTPHGTAPRSAPSRAGRARRWTSCSGSSCFRPAGRAPRASTMPCAST